LEAELRSGQNESRDIYEPEECKKQLRSVLLACPLECDIGGLARAWMNDHHETGKKTNWPERLKYPPIFEYSDAPLEQGRP